jgi:hypothetical protein
VLAKRAQPMSKKPPGILRVHVTLPLFNLTSAAIANVSYHYSDVLKLQVDANAPTRLRDLPRLDFR